MSVNTRYTIVKDYVREDGELMQDTWCILYGTAPEAEAAMARLQAGQDTSWFDPAGEDMAFLYVDQIEL